MKQIGCDQEAAVSRAVRTGEWHEALKAHVAGCVECRQFVQISRWMLSLASLADSRSEGIAALPEPGLVWWRVQLAQKQSVAERAQRKLQWIESVTLAMVLLGVGGGFAWIWPQFQGQLPTLLSDAWPRFLDAASAASLVPAVYSWLTLPLLMALCAVVIFVVYPFLIEE